MLETQRGKTPAGRPETGLENAGVMLGRASEHALCI